MRRRFAALAAALLFVSPRGALRAQGAPIRVDGEGRGRELVQHAAAGPHVVIAGVARLDIPRDSTIHGSLIVLDRPTRLAGRVEGDVVVIGADLFLQPGVDVTGNVTAIGGSVMQTSLGRVAGTIESRRDDAFTWAREGSGYRITVVSAVDVIGEGWWAPTGAFTYDRVDGLSLGVGTTLQFREHAVEAEPTVTYRSRLGAWDPALTLRLNPQGRVRVDALVARETRTNDDWIYGDFANSLLAFFAGIDTRNYYRATRADARATASLGGGRWTFEPFVAARSERVSAITAVGNVFSVRGRQSLSRMARPNPVVEEGTLTSALLGGELRAEAGVVTSRVAARVEQSFATPTATSSFTQLTLDGAVTFPTFGTQQLHVRAHGVATRGDSVPAARYTYLGGSGTLRTLEMLEQGGTALVYVENRYTIPLPMITLPVLGAPTLTLRDAFGGAGVGSIPPLQHEVGIGLGARFIRVDVARGVTGRRETEIGVVLTLSQ